MRAPLGLSNRLLGLLGWTPRNRRQRRAAERRRSLVRRSRFDALEPRVVLNADPVANDDEFYFYYSQAAEFSENDLIVNDEDSDFDTLTVTSVDSTTSEGGSVSFSGGVWTYTKPTSTFYGSDTFGYEVSDGNGGFDTGTITINIFEPMAPTVDVLEAWIDPNGHTLHIIFVGTDEDGDHLDFSYDDGNGSYGSGSYLYGGYMAQEWVGEINDANFGLMVTVEDADGLMDWDGASFVFWMQETYGMPQQVRMGEPYGIYFNMLFFESPELGGSFDITDFDPSYFVSLAVGDQGNVGNVELDNGWSSYYLTQEGAFDELGQNDVGDEYRLEYSSSRFTFFGDLYFEVLPPEEQPKVEVAQKASDNDECSCGCCKGKAKADEKTGSASSHHEVSSTVDTEYNSQAESDSIVHVPTLITNSLPEVFGVELTFDGIQQDPVYFEKGELENGQFTDLGLLAETAGMASGVYEWSARIFDPSDDSTLRTIEGVKAVVNTTQTGLSSGWAISGVDRLVVDTDNVLLVRPNGTWTRFKSDGVGGFTTPEGLGALEEITGGYRWSSEDGTYAEFDEAGLLQIRVDLNGNTVTYTWVDGFLTEIEDAVGRVTTFGYTDDLLTSITDPDGRITTLAYDSMTDELTSFTMPDPDDGGALSAPVTSFTYSSGRLATQTDAEGGVYSITYDGTGRVSSITDPEEKTISLVAADLYGTPGTGLGTEMDPATAVLLGDRQGSQTDAEGHVTLFKLDRFGLRTSETDELGRVTLFDRDTAGHVITRTAVDQGPGNTDIVTTYEYDGDNLTRTLYDDGHSEEWDFISDTDRVSEYRLKDDEDNVVARTLYEYDVSGNRTKQTRVIGAVDEEVNNDLDPNNDECNDHIIQYDYLTAANGLPEGLIETITEWAEDSGDDVVTSYTYYDNTNNSSHSALIGLVKSVTRGTSGLSSTTKYAYDEFGNLTRETQVVGDDDDGIGITENDDRITLYEYDLLDRVTKITRVAGEGVDEELNADMDGGNDEYDDAVTRYQYDAAGRVVSQTQVVGEADDPTGANDDTTDIIDDSLTLTEYDSAGRVVKTTQVVGHIDAIVNADMDGGNDEDDDVVHSYVYDDGDLISETDALGRTTTYDYVDHQLLRRTDPDPDDTGTLPEPVTEYRYDAVGRLTHVIQVIGELDDEINMETDDLVNETVYDVAGRVYQTIDPLNRTTTYTYDALGRTVEIAGPMSTVAYVYDARGNVVDQFTTGDLNAPAHLHYEYDELGRRITSTQVRGELDAEAIDPGSDPDDQVTTTEYDRLGRVAAQVDPLGRRTEYRYDGLGNAAYIVTIVDSGETDFDSPVLNLVTRYIYNNAGDLIQITAPDPDGSGNPGLSPVTDVYYDRLGRQVLSRQVVGATADTLGSLVDDVVNETVYDNLGRVVSTIDPRGGVTAYAYDALGRQITVTLPDPDDGGSQSSPVTETTYNKLGQVTAVLDARGFVTTYEYDALNRLVKVSLPHDPMAMSFDYALQRTYDEAGRVIEELDALSRLTTYTYDAAGRLVEAVYDDVVDVTMTYQYDAADRPEEIIDPIHGSMQRVYDDELRTVEDYVYWDSSWTLIRTTTYDDLGRVVSVETEGSATTAASVTTYVYALDGQLLSEATTDDEDEVLRRTDYVYDDHTGWRTLVVQVKGERDDGINMETDDLVSETVYDNLGRVVSQIDPLTHATEYEYDRLSRLVLQTDAAAGETAYYYDQASNRTDLVDPEGNNTHWIYDALNRVIEENQQDEYEGLDLNSRTFVYDAAGNLIRKVDRLDRYVDYVYDEQGRRTHEYWFEELDAPANPVALGGDPQDALRTIVTTYDALGRVLTIIDWDGEAPTNPAWDVGAVSGYEYDYDRFDRLLVTTAKLDGADDVVLTQTYDARGNRDSVAAEIDTDADFTTTYEYDAYDQLARLAQAQETGTTGQNAVGAKWAEFTYNGLGQFSTVSRGTSTDPVVVATYEYDAFARLEALTHRLGDGESSSGAPDDVVAGYEYAYDGAGRITDFTNTQHSAESATFNYDSTNQLTAADRSGSSSDESYDYDANGNRVESGYGSADYAYETDDHNRTTRRDWTHFIYDDEGNLIEKTQSKVIHVNWGDAETTISLIHDSIDYEYIDLATENNAAAIESIWNAFLVTLGYDTNTLSVTGSGGSYDVEVLKPDGSGSYAFLETYFTIDGDYVSANPTMSVGQAYRRDSYSWDFRNRLVDVQIEGDAVAASRVVYKYDPSDRLLLRALDQTPDGNGDLTMDDATAERVLYDGNQIVLIMTGDYNSTLVVSRRMVWGSQVDQLLAQEQFNAGGNSVTSLYWVLADHQNTVRDLRDAGGSSVQHFAYDSFGNLISGSTTYTSFLYTGRYFDSVTGLQNNWHRWYDPQLGKWISEDWIGFAAGDANLTRYVGNSAPNLTDPSGLAKLDFSPKTIRGMPWADKNLNQSPVARPDLELVAVSKLN